MKSENILTNPQKEKMIYHEHGSFWHNIELRSKDNLNEFNYIIEILPYTREKMEVDKKLDKNPIHLDRIYPKPIPFAYGCLPRTYEDPKKIDPILKIYGDDDPLDVCDVTNLVCEKILENDKLFNYPYSGQIKQGVIIGMLAIRDKGFADWKIIMVEKNIHDMCMRKNIDNILNNEIKKIVKEWYESDPKSEVLQYDESHENIQIVIEHAERSYKAMMEKI